MLKLILTTLILTSMCLPATAQDKHDHSSHEHEHDHAHHNNKPELFITPVSPATLTAGQENEVILFIQDMTAKPVDVSRFEVTHTKPLHLLITEPGLNDYHHKHPIQKAPGQYVFTFTPQTSCSYRIWADVQLTGSYQHYIPINLQGTEECEKSDNTETVLKTSSNGYDFSLETEGALKAGQEITAEMRITKDGKPVDFLEPIMGTFAHMVGFYDDYETIAHVHPVTEKSNGQSERGGPVLRFHIEPEQSGYIKLFVQVKIEGKDIFAPFRVAVSQ